MLRPEQITQELNSTARCPTVWRLGQDRPRRRGSESKDTVFREDKLVLYCYRPQREQIPRFRCWSSMPWSTSPMTDLQEDCSIVRGLLDQGVDLTSSTGAILTAPTGFSTSMTMSTAIFTGAWIWSATARSTQHQPVRSARAVPRACVMPPCTRKGAQPDHDGDRSTFTRR